MAFRDDREILKERARELERSLAAAERELERRRDAEKRAAELEVELATAQRLLRRSAPTRASPESSRAAGVSIALVLGFSAMGGMFVVRGTPRPTYIPAPPLRLPLPPVEKVEVPALEKPSALEAARAAAPGSVDLQPYNSVVARFHGSVRSATGLALPKGTSCEVRSLLRSNDKHEVSIRCGTIELYDSTLRLEDTAQISSEARELPGKAGTSHASLVWQDSGLRIGLRTEASVDTPGRVAVAWREMAPSFRVEIDVQERSEAYEGSFLRPLSSNDR